MPMNSGVTARALFCHLPLRNLGLAAVVATFASCAQHSTSSDASRSGVTGQTTGSSEIKALAPSRGISPTLVGNPKVQRVTPPLGDAADRIVTEVATGRLSQSGDDYLVFVRTKTARAKPAQSLYGDAIALGQLRSKLKSVPGAPHSSCREATVHSGGAVIPIKDSLSAATTASMVDSALSVDLIQSVRVNLPTAPR